MKKSAPEEPLGSPIPFHTGSNGELSPRAPTDQDAQAERLYRDVVDDRSRQLGMSRREFAASSAGTAAALLVINQVYGCGDGGYRVDPDGCQALDGDPFIFDVQTHHVNPNGPWRGGTWEFALGAFPQAGCGEPDAMNCFDANHYVREMFVNSETHVAVLSAVPAVEEDQPLNREEAAMTRDILETLPGSPRLITHGLVLPDRGQAQLDGMQHLKETLRISAWKVYTQFGGWRFTDPEGIAFLERARALDIKIVCAHKGLSLFGLDPAFASPADIGAAAGMFGDLDFVVYHSAYETSHTEGPYDPLATVGVDTLIKTLADHDLGPGDNVYAELGSTWRSLMTKPDQAQHVLGKLLKHLGEDRILWGTDSIWYGSPQGQIDAFRAFEISAELQEVHGYPALTPAAKEKILGLNAANLYGIDVAATRCEIDADALTARRRERDRPAARFHAYGPQSRREFFAFLKTRNGMPG